MIALLKKYWLDLLIGATLIALLVTLQITQTQRDKYLAERNAARVQVSALSDQIKDQNKGIADLAAAAEANREVYLAGLAAANRTATRLEIKAEDILALPSPVDPNEQCTAARALLIGGDQ